MLFLLFCGALTTAEGSRQLPRSIAPEPRDTRATLFRLVSTTPPARMARVGRNGCRSRSVRRQARGLLAPFVHPQRKPLCVDTASVFGQRCSNSCSDRATTPERYRKRPRLAKGVFRQGVEYKGFPEPSAVRARSSRHSTDTRSRHATHAGDLHADAVFSPLPVTRRLSAPDFLPGEIPAKTTRGARRQRRASGCRFATKFQVPGRRGSAPAARH